MLLHDLLSCSYLQHCVWSVITGHNSLQTACLCTACDKSKPSRRCNSHGWARSAAEPTIASREMRQAHAVDDLTWPACRWTCTTVFATKMRYNRSIRDVKASKLARKPNRNTKQNTVNPSNITHTRRTGSLLTVSRGVLYFDHRTHVPH